MVLHPWMRNKLEPYGIEPFIVEYCLLGLAYFIHSMTAIYDVSTSQGRSSTRTLEAVEPNLKRHAACDECRHRKLKCSGDTSGCSRCVRLSLVCHYSIQKQMGRPPKKRMREDDNVSDPSAGEMIDPSSLTTGLAAGAASEANSIFPPFYCATVAKMKHIFPHLQTETSDVSNDLSRAGSSSSCLFPIPATASPWPDFSVVSASSSGLPETFSEIPHHSTFSNANPEGDERANMVSECACLSYLYLCLSNLSTLSSYPITQQTICSLYIAARTARDVLRCEVCPTKFAEGMQNVMLSGTLLNVIADSWVRVSKADASELGQQSSLPQYVSLINDTPDPMKSWRDWLRQVVRRAVIGGPSDPSANIQCPEIPDLLSLIKEMEARQRKWHLEPESLPFPLGRLRIDGEHWLDASAKTNSHNHSDHDSQAGKRECDERDWLCLRVAQSARKVLSQLNFQPHEYPGGIVS